MDKVKSFLTDTVTGLFGNFLWVILVTAIGGDAVITATILVILSKVTQNVEIPLWELGIIIATFVFILILLIVLVVNKSVNMIRKRRFYSRLLMYIKEHDFIKSIQFYDLYKFIDDEMRLNIKVKRLGGIKDESFDTNCILGDGYQIPHAFYSECKTLLDLINDDQKRLQKNEMDLLELENHKTMIENKCREIFFNHFSKLKMKDLTQEHFVYYRILFILAYKGYDFLKIVQKYNHGEPTENWDDECDTVLGKNKRWLERTLQNGKKSQYLAALILDETFCFEHEANSLKQGRCYFSSKFSMPKKNNEYLMIVTYDVEKLAAVTKKEKVYECNKIRDEILDLLICKKGA